MLPLPHHTEIAVVEDRELHDESFLNHGGDLRHVHLKSAVAGNRPDRLIRARETNTHRRRHREAHGAQTPRRNVRVGPLEGIALRDPHLMLADVRHDCRLATGDVGERGENRLGSEPIREDLLARTHQPANLIVPLWAIPRRDKCQQSSNDRLGVSADP